MCEKTGNIVNIAWFCWQKVYLEPLEPRWPVFLLEFVPCFGDTEFQQIEDKEVPGIYKLIFGGNWRIIPVDVSG